jgi:hypothetical protein
MTTNVLPRNYNKRLHALHTTASTMPIASTDTPALCAVGSAAKAVLLSVGPIMAHIIDQLRKDADTFLFVSPSSIKTAVTSRPREHFRN